jgi:hypothetical protein
VIGSVLPDEKIKPLFFVELYVFACVANCDGWGVEQRKVYRT